MAGAELKDHGTFRSSYQLDDDAWAGFQSAAKNNQPRLAMEYLIKVMADLQGQINELKTALEAPKAAEKPKPAEKSKVTAKQEAPKDGEDAAS